jgi:hypothetical protein
MNDINEENYLEKQAEIVEFFNTKVNKTDKLTKRFEEFHESNPQNTLFCGVSQIYIYI